MKLYFSPGACSLSPHIVLLEAGLQFATERVDLRAKVTDTGADYRAINPKGSVPALEIDGSLLTEGPAIVQYLADLAPEKHLAPPAGSLERYQLQEWLNYLGTEVHKTYSPLFNPAISEDAKYAAMATLATRYAYLDKVLGEREYLNKQFSVADVYLYVLTNWAGRVGFNLSAYPNVRAHHGRIHARPAVQRALSDEGLLSK
jgi:glutathione S-transferase